MDYNEDFCGLTDSAVESLQMFLRGSGLKDLCALILKVKATLFCFNMNKINLITIGVLVVHSAQL